MKNHTKWFHSRVSQDACCPEIKPKRLGFRQSSFDHIEPRPCVSGSYLTSEPIRFTHMLLSPMSFLTPGKRLILQMTSQSAYSSSAYTGAHSSFRLADVARPGRLFVPGISVCGRKPGLHLFGPIRSCTVLRRQSRVFVQTPSDRTRRVQTRLKR